MEVFEVTVVAPQVTEVIEVVTGDVTVGVGKVELAERVLSFGTADHAVGVAGGETGPMGEPCASG